MMSVFALAASDKEIQEHMAEYIKHANALATFYKDYNFECSDSDWEAGWVEFVHVTTDYDANRYGNVHGGIIMMLADTAAGLAAYETGTGNSSPTMDMSVSFLRAIHIGDVMRLRSQVINVSKHNCTVCTDIIVNGELAATTTSMHRLYTNTKPDIPVLLVD